MRAQLAAAVLLFAASGAAFRDEVRLCLGPRISHTLEGLVKDHAFQGMLPHGFRLERLDVKPDHVEMGYDDDAGPAVTVVLALPGAEPRPPAAARGPHFEHRIVDERGRASGPARETMLRAAMLVDHAIPATALQCEGAREGGTRAPTRFGLGTGRWRPQSCSPPWRWGWPGAGGRHRSARRVPRQRPART